MSRCFCACHQYPGVYSPPCGYCGHDDREGRMVRGINDGWEPNEAVRIVSGAEWRQRAEVAETDNARLREALTLIARGTWTAKNSVESIVWTARQALKLKDNG